MKWWQVGILALVGLWMLKPEEEDPSAVDGSRTSAPGGFATPGEVEEPDVASPGPVVLTRTGPADLAGPGGEPVATASVAYWQTLSAAIEAGDCPTVQELVALGPP